MANLGPQKQSTSYLGLLQVPDGLTTVLKNVTDGLGASTPLQLSTTNIGFSSLTMTGPINMGGYQINNLGAPTASTDAVTKAYVDSVAAGLQPKQQCVAGTVANITLSGEQNIDDIDVVAGDRVLVKNQSIQADNGIYIVSSGAWTRSSDANTWEELVGAYVFVVDGTVNTATSWVCNSPVVGTLGVTAVTWIKFSSSTSTLSNFLTFDAQGDGDQGYTDILTENGYNLITEDNEYITIQTPGLIQFNGSAPVLISYNSIGAIALDGSNAAPGSTWDISVIGNAGTVTNGVYTSGSYSDPAWITGIASSKLIGAVAVNRGGTGTTTLSGILFGNGSNAVTTATAADIVSAIGSIAVANATNAVNATTATTAITATTATTTTQTDFSNLTIGGSQVLDAANFNSYAPTLTGTGASGTWPINISGNAETVTSAQTATLRVTSPGGGSYSPATTVRPLSNSIGDFVSIWDFYISGQTYWDAAISNALSALGANGCLYFPAGTYQISNQISISNANVTIRGAGNATIIRQNTPNKPIIVPTGVRLTVSDMQLVYATQGTSSGGTSGAAIYIVAGNQGTYNNLWIYNAYVGMECGNGANVNSAMNISIYDFTYAGFYFHDNAYNTSVTNFWMGISDSSSGLGSQGNIVLINRNEGHTFQNGQIYQGVNALYCNASSATYANSPNFCFFTNVYFDSATYTSNIANSAFLYFTGCWFSGGRSVITPQPGAYVYQSHDIIFTNCGFTNNGSYGALVETGCNRVNFIGCQFNSNSYSSSGTFDGLCYANNNTNFSVVGCIANGGFITNRQRYGIFIGSGCTDFVLTDNQVAGNLSGGIQNNSTGDTVRVYSNPGANDLFQYHDVKGSRSLTGPSGTVYNYQNTTSRPIFVEAFGTSGSTNNMNMWISATSGALGSGYAVSGQSGTAMSVSSYVPPGWWYRVESQTPSGVTILSWGEMY